MISFNLSVAADFVVHIGAGSGAEVPSYCEAGLIPVILAEADPEAIPHLRRLEDQFPAVRVVQAAVSARCSGLTYYRSNFSELNSLRPPSQEMRDLFPGLAILEQAPIAGTEPKTFLDTMELPAGQAGLLVLQVPGEALGIVDALAGAALLDRFSAIRVQEGLTPLYEGGSCIPVLRTRLMELGFACLMEAGSEDPDRPHLLACRDGLGPEAVNSLQALSGALQESESARGGLEAEREALQGQLVQTSAELDAAVAEYAAAAEGMVQLEQARAAALAEFETERDALQARLSRQESEAAELAGAQQAAEVARAELAAEGDALRTQLAAAQEAAEVARAELAAEGDALRTQLARQESEAAELRADAETLRGSLEEQRRARESVEAEILKLREELAQAWQMSRDFEQRVAELEPQLEAEQAARKAADATLEAQEKETEAFRVREAELEQRRLVGEREMQRAEGQIELIKDLLLRGDVL